MSGLPDYIESIEDDGDDVTTPPVVIPDGATVATLGAKFMELKAAAAKHEADRKQANSLLQEVEAQLALLMETQKLDKFQAHGVTFYTKPEAHPHVLAEKREDFYHWLEENGHGSIVKLSVHPKTLQSWVTNQLKAGEKVPEMCSVFHKTHVRTRKANSK